MNDTKLISPEHIRAFLEGTSNVKFIIAKEKKYAWLAKTIKQTNYFSLKKKDKSVIREYILNITEYSRQQLTKLIKQYKEKHWIGIKQARRNSFTRKYFRKDILLLVKTDQYHQTLSGATTKKLFERAYNIFKDFDYENLSRISISHIYNLRKSKCYQQKRKHFTKTKNASVKIGERRKPQPNGYPGYIRIDTVHQGDKDKQKGVYHINAIDELTQFEIVCSVEKISENYLIPVLEALLNSFPFIILNFHSDNGSEYINKNVVKLLNKLHINLTKSRARHTNDNALVESKNGSIIRKFFGYLYIEQRWAKLINEFNKNYLTPYINFHRPCYFSKTKINKKGKEIKIYPYSLMMTPYEKFKSLSNASNYLKDGITFTILDKQAMAFTDLEAAKTLKKAWATLIQTIEQ